MASEANKMDMDTKVTNVVDFKSEFKIDLRGCLEVGLHGLTAQRILLERKSDMFTWDIAHHRASTALVAASL